MIVKAEMKFSLYGESFSPHKLSELTGIEFSQVFEKGVTHVPSGRFEGQIAHFSKASIKTQSESGSDYNDVLHLFLTKFDNEINGHIDESGVDKVTLWIHFLFDEEGQTGFELRPDNLLLIGQMGVSLAVDITQPHQGRGHA